MGKSLVAHSIARSIFGAREAENFSVSIKTVAEWFPKKRTGISYRDF